MATRAAAVAGEQQRQQIAERAPQRRIGDHELHGDRGAFAHALDARDAGGDLELGAADAGQQQIDRAADLAERLVGQHAAPSATTAPRP